MARAAAVMAAAGHEMDSLSTPEPPARGSGGPVRVRSVMARTEKRAAAIQLGLIRAGFAIIRRTVGIGYQTWVRCVARLFFGGGRVEVEIEGGVRLTVRLRDAYWIASLFAGNEYEPEVAAALTGLLGGRSAFVDCGANIGVWSSVAAGLIGARDRVLAVEPGEETTGELRRNAALAPNGIRVVAAAVWSASHSMLTFLERRAHTDSSLADVASPSREHAVTTRPVATISLDDLIRDAPADANVIVLKLDLEGAEIACLASSSRLIDAPLVIIYEDHGSDPQHTVSAWFLAHGFSLFGFVFETGGFRPVTLEEIARRKVSKAAGYNFVAVRNGREALLAGILVREAAAETRPR